MGGKERGQGADSAAGNRTASTTHFATQIEQQEEGRFVLQQSIHAVYILAVVLV